MTNSLPNPFLQVKETQPQKNHQDFYKFEKVVIYSWNLLFPTSKADLFSVLLAQRLVPSPSPSCPALEMHEFLAELSPDFSKLIYEYYQILHEFINTEFRYLHQLYLLEKVFFDPICEQKLLQDGDQHRIFGHLKDLIKEHQTFINELFREKKIRQLPKLIEMSTFYTVKSFQVSFDELTVLELECKILNFLKSVKNIYLDYCKNYSEAKTLFSILSESFDDARSTSSSVSSLSSEKKSKISFRDKISAPSKAADPLQADKTKSRNLLREFLDFTKINQSQILAHLECADYLYATYQRTFRYQLLTQQLMKIIEKCLSLTKNLEEMPVTKNNYSGDSKTVNILDQPLEANPFQEFNENPFNSLKELNPFKSVQTSNEEAERKFRMYFCIKRDVLKEILALLDHTLKEANQAYK